MKYYCSICNLPWEAADVIEVKNLSSSSILLLICSSTCLTSLKDCWLKNLRFLVKKKKKRLQVTVYFQISKKKKLNTTLIFWFLKTCFKLGTKLALTIFTIYFKPNLEWVFGLYEMSFPLVIIWGIPTLVVEHLTYFMQFMKPQALIIQHYSVPFGSLLIPPSLNKINIAFLKIGHFAPKRRIEIYHLVQNLSTHHLHSLSVYNYITLPFCQTQCNT